IASSGGITYIGGLFTQVGPRTGPGVGIDATSGQSTGLPEVSGGSAVVEAVVPDGAGGWYVGGAFTRVGGLPRLNLAHIRADRVVDPRFHPDPNNEVAALAVSGSIVYAGGTFTSIGGTNQAF